VSAQADRSGTVAFGGFPTIAPACWAIWQGRQANPSDAIAILAVKDQLRLTAAQTPQLGDINAEARGKAVVVLKQ